MTAWTNFQPRSYYDYSTRLDTLFMHSMSQPIYIQVDVTWRPPQIFLHYDGLYRGIYEYLRAPPSNEKREAALQYLSDIRENNPPHPLNPYNFIQHHRILWIVEWIKALPDDSGECSDAETVIEVD
jgi:hypothetical protein